MTVSIDNHVSWDLRRILVGIMFELKPGGGGGGGLKLCSHIIMFPKIPMLMFIIYRLHWELLMRAMEYFYY